MIMTQAFQNAATRTIQVKDTRGTIGRAALELENTTSAEVSEVQSVRGKRPAYSQ
jgi:hypothetical protein